jgi:hypothetical protein
MATFAELVADVKLMTNRPDLDAEIKLAVKAATLKAHQTDYYPYDMYGVAIQWNPIAYQQRLDYITLIPRWRSFKYIRKYTPATPIASSVDGVFFKVIEPESSLDGYGINKENVCYLAGIHIEIRSNTMDEYMLLGCYLHPDVNETTYDSWVAISQPYAITYEATSKIFKQTGYDEQAAMLNKEVIEQYTLLRNNNIIMQGY